MSPTYYLYSGRMQGWFTNSGTYSSDFAEARKYSRVEAIAMCKRHKSQGGYQLLPISADDMEAVG